MSGLEGVLALHDDPPGWTVELDGDGLIYECSCGAHSPALAQDHISPDDAMAASKWHRAHVAAEVRAWIGEQFMRAEIDTEDAVLETMSLGTSGRYIADYGQTPDSIAAAALGVVRGRLAGEGGA